MPQQRYVQLPNGSYLEWPENVSADEFKAKALKVMGQVAAPNADLKPAANAAPPNMQTGRTPFLTSYASALSQMPKGLYHQAKASLLPFSKEAQEQSQREDADAARFIAEGGGLDAVAKELGRMYQRLTPVVRTSDKPNADIDWGGTAANLTPMVASLIGGKALGKLNKAPLEEVSGEITNAVNPPPKQMMSYQKSLSQNLNKILTFAASKGINVNSIDGLATAMKEAGDTIRTHYYEKILGPVKDVPMDISGIKGYSGETASPSTANLGQLDARLSQINAELNPKFAKGGIAAQAAVKSAGDLNAEASSIRSVLYDRLGKATGLDPKVIADTRASFGSLNNLAEQTNLAASRGRFSANKEASGPITLNPFGGSKGKEFVLDKAANAVRGNPTSNAISKAIRKAGVSRYQLPTPSPVAARAAIKPPRTPPWMGANP